MDKIKNPYRASQIIDCSGLLDSPMLPTDIDGILDIHNKAWVIIEAKYKDKELPIGQRVAIERMVKDLSLTGKPSVAIVVRHSVADSQKSVYIANELVSEVYFSEEQVWRKPKFNCTASYFVKTYIEWCGIKI